MLVSSLTRRAADACSRSLFKRLKGNRASLRHITARLELVGYQQEITSSVPFTSLQLFCKPTHCKPQRAIGTRHLPRTMSDDAYSSFLDQANQDTGASKASTKSKSAATKAVDTDVPVTLQKVDQYYTSESDEPFEPVSLKWSGKNMPSESMQQKTVFKPRER